jgi:hypothetical protein
MRLKEAYYAVGNNHRAGRIGQLPRPGTLGCMASWKLPKARDWPNALLLTSLYGVAIVWQKIDLRCGLTFSGWPSITPCVPPFLGDLPIHS